MMKTNCSLNLQAAALVCAPPATSVFAQELPTTGTVKSPLGPIEIKNDYKSQAMSVNPCSLKCLSKAKTVLIPEVRMTSKLTQSTRLRFRLDADRRAATPDRCVPEATNSMVISGRISS